MSDGQQTSSWRIRLGCALFLLSVGWPILIPALPVMGMPAATVATLSGVMVVAAELLMLAGAAIAGKEGFAFIKARAFGLLRSVGPPRDVSRTRYTVGLIMFVLPLLYGWVSPYLAHFLPGIETNRMVFAVAGDALLLVSLFVLGGAFWDKLRSLFLHDATAVFSQPAAGADVSHR